MYRKAGSTLTNISTSAMSSKNVIDGACFSHDGQFLYCAVSGAAMLQIPLNRVPSLRELSVAAIREHEGREQTGYVLGISSAKSAFTCTYVYIYICVLPPFGTRILFFSFTLHSSRSLYSFMYALHIAALYTVLSYSRSGYSFIYTIHTVLYIPYL